MKIDNEYFVASRHEHPLPRVVPYKGKHAVKISKFFDRVQSQQRKNMPDDWIYRPLKFEVEITDGCNQSCIHCGMSANATDDCNYLRRDLLLSIPHQLQALGIPGISITGGEPFTTLPTLLDLLSECRGKVDVIKLTTNAYWAQTHESALYHLNLLASRGFLESRFFRPVLMISIGEQKVPLQSVVNAICAARSLFNDKELALCISSLSFSSGENRLSELEQCYKKTVEEEFPWDSVYLTQRSYISAGRAVYDKKLSHRSIPLTDICKDRGCFRQTVGAIVVPTPLIKSDGSVFTCSVFGIPQDLFIGNVADLTIMEILTVANNCSYVRLLANGNLPALIQDIPDYMVKNVFVDNFHEACWRLIKMHKGMA